MPNVFTNRQPDASPSRNSGFTLMELLVSVSLTVVILGLVNSVFNDTTRAVSRGADTSQIIAQSRTISDQIFSDAKEMVTYEDPINRSGEPGAFLVIVQKTTGATVLFPDDPQQSRQEPSGWTNFQSIRSDQLVWFRDAQSLQAQTPGLTGDYGSEAKAGLARIWYGHVSPDGSDPGANTDHNNITQLRLGRQALLLVADNDKQPDGSDGNTAIAASTIIAELDTGGAIPTTATEIDESPVNGIAGGEELWQGATDVLRINAIDAFDSTLTPAPGLYTTPAIMLDANELPTGNYNDSALSWAYLKGNKRLRVDPYITFPYDPEDVGRTHTMLSPYVSDFAVDFAADITDDWDYVTPGVPDDGKTWVGVGTATDDVADNEPDTTGEFGQIKWYNAVNPNDPGFPGFDPTLPTTFALPSTAGTIHSTPTSGGNSYPPFVGIAAGPPAQAIFVFGHTGDTEGADTLPYTADDLGSAKWWPYMIRIRYRLHDADATFGGANPITGEIESGKWFEQIIPVPRAY